MSAGKQLNPSEAGLAGFNERAGACHILRLVSMFFSIIPII